MSVLSRCLRSSEMRAVLRSTHALKRTQQRRWNQEDAQKKQEDPEEEGGTKLKLDRKTPTDATNKVPVRIIMMGGIWGIVLCMFVFAHRYYNTLSIVLPNREKYKDDEETVVTINKKSRVEEALSVWRDGMMPMMLPNMGMFSPFAYRRIPESSMTPEERAEARQHRNV
eukprot:TRINITY_DN21977_c0_g1_i2.p1 TRINITY_DN21977_c0_g1~~TRINITY_DN21977_c0_g1_i2.p1  ORF type:complete len:169 (+),score=44.45 TRINITY_DN21977_c0_g1_i2:176-682(+)